RGRHLSIDNERALQLKASSPLGKSIRALVSGYVTRVFPDRNGHAHFEIQMTEDPRSNLEVVYSLSFGDMPEPSVGSQVIACGDFINSYAPNNGYPPSPSGALIHWVHRSTSPKHDSGYVVLDNVVYGDGPEERHGHKRGYEH